MSTDEQLDDAEFFQQDFTTASEWEVFNARLEEQFTEWRLPFIPPGPPLQRDQLSRCEWQTTAESINFSNVEFTLTLYHCVVPEAVAEADGKTTTATVTAKKKPAELGATAMAGTHAFADLLSEQNNYALPDEKLVSQLHPVARWYGLRDFVVLSPTRRAITNDSQINQLLSSLHIAVAESQCAIPVFFQMLEPGAQVFSGVCENRQFRVGFDVVHLRHLPPAYQYLSGLLEMFARKVDVRYVDRVKVSVRLTYSLQHFPPMAGTVGNELDFETADMLDDAQDLDGTGGSGSGSSGSATAVDCAFKLSAFRVSIDPMSELVLYADWPLVADNVIIDSQNFTDFNPMRAPLWRMRARFAAPTICRMSECLAEYAQRHEDRQTLGDLLGNGFNMLGDEAERNPFEILTESKITQVLPSFVTGAASAGGKPGGGGSGQAKSKGPNKLDGPLVDGQLMQMLYYMFPDAQQADAAVTNQYIIPEEDAIDPLRIKSALPDSLVHRMSVLLAMCNSYYGGKRAVAQLWAEFTQEMRFRVERCIQIPGVAPGFPDSRTCLLHQKLQMLNVCMERRRIREGGLPFAMTRRHSQTGRSGESEEDDEFYDCSADDEDDKLAASAAPWNRPEGRLSRLGEQTLVGSDEPLYIPVTQEPVPKTEDQLEKDAEIMLQLGPDNKLRLQMMSASLLSDMASFKAANLNGQIEDFIRWYSPRDWIEDDTTTEPAADGATKPRGGRLSSRMLIPDNTWQQVWETAKPVPARRQKRLFDDTKEAEKILHYFESQSIGQIVRLTLATLGHSALLAMAAQNAAEPVQVPNYAELHDRLVGTLCRLSREPWTESAANGKNNSATRWEHLLAEITNVELLAAKSRSLMEKLYDSNADALEEHDRAFIGDILAGMDGELRGAAAGPVSQRVVALFAEAKRSRDAPFGEEPSNAEEEAKVAAKAELMAGLTAKQRERAELMEQGKWLPSPVEKQFTMRQSGRTVDRGMGGPQFLRAILQTHDFRLCGAFSQDITFF